MIAILRKHVRFFFITISDPPTGSRARRRALAGDRIVTMLATHGSALQSTSYSFLMSTHRDISSHLRAGEASAIIRAF